MLRCLLSVARRGVELEAFELCSKGLKVSVDDK